MDIGKIMFMVGRLRYMGLLLVLVPVLLLRCTRPEYSQVIDTVACPVVATVKKIGIAAPYYHRKVQNKAARFYEATDYKKFWLEKKHPAKRYKAFVNEVMEAYRYGINPDDYDIREIEKEVGELYQDKNRTDEELSRLDIRITASFFLFTTHLLEGRIRNPGARDFIWKKGLPEEDDVSMLLNMKSASDLRHEIDNLHPKDPQYEKLRHALKVYKDMSEADDFPPIKLKRQIPPGGKDHAIVVIRKKLQLTDHKGDPMPLDSMTYDEALVRAVRQFQKRHGLDASGLIDPETAKYLNIPLKGKSELIALNLERLRWHPRPDYQTEQVIVNVPEYMLRVYRNNEKKLDMRVILGSDFNATPIFCDTLKYIVFSPTWNVPKSILEEEFLPRLRENPAYYGSEFRFFKNGVEIDPEEEDWSDEELDVRSYQAIQSPGNLNSLGNVKFVMPNNFNIYLHDTPADNLFKGRDRALSHGCVRLEQPVEFASYLLADNELWDKGKIMEAMQRQEPVTAPLKRPVPVYITYRTVWVDDDGLVNFRHDIYGHDQRQLALLKKSGNFEGVISGR